MPFAAQCTFPRLLPSVHIRLTKPASVARVLRTSSKTKIIPTNGINPAAITIGSNTCVVVACRASEKYPINSNAIIVPIPAPVPLKPLTVATESFLNRSVGNTFAIVEKDAYENVAIANSKVIVYKSLVKIVGINSVTPKPPNTTSAFRAVPTVHPR